MKQREWFRCVGVCAYISLAGVGVHVDRARGRSGRTENCKVNAEVRRVGGGGDVDDERK